MERETSKQIEALNKKLVKLEDALSDISSRLFNQPKLLFADETRILIEAETFFWEFPKAQINHALSYLNPGFDQGLRAFLYANIKADSTFIDIGANAGILTCIGAKLVGANGQAISVEPITDLAATIRRNVFMNAPLTPYEHHIAAAGGHERSQVFQVFKNDSRVSTLHFEHSSAATDEYNEIEVHVLDIRSIIPKTPTNVFLKIDAEGNEEEIMSAVLEHWKNESWHNTHIVFEFGRQHFDRAEVSLDNFVKRLLDLGLSINLINPYSGMRENPLTADISNIVDGNYVISSEAPS